MRKKAQSYEEIKELHQSWQNDIYTQLRNTAAEDIRNSRRMNAPPNP